MGWTHGTILAFVIAVFGASIPVVYAGCADRYSALLVDSVRVRAEPILKRAHLKIFGATDLASARGVRYKVPIVDGTEFPVGSSFAVIRHVKTAPEDPAYRLMAVQAQTEEGQYLPGMVVWVVEKKSGVVVYAAVPRGGETVSEKVLEFAQKSIGRKVLSDVYH